MKKLFASILLFAVTGILLSSCSNSSKLTFAKRHYRSGYYVNLGGKVNSVAVSPSSKHPTIANHPASPVATAKPEGYVPVNAPVAATAKSVVVGKIVVPKNIQENSLTSTNSILVRQKTTILNPEENSGVAASAGDGHRDHDNVNVPYVVIVLCAIFIPPLGVGLMYGINSYFWIDLILTLLFFFPGMIFALIVVLM